MPAAVIAVVAAVAASYAGSAGVAALVAAGYLTAGSAAALFTTALIGAVVATAVTYAGSALLGLNTPKSQALAESSQEREQLIQSSSEEQRVIYGRARVGGPIVYATSTGERKEFLHLIIPLAGHRCSHINAIWINDVPVYQTELDANGDITNPDSQFYTWARIRTHTGQQIVADSELLAESPDGWTAEHIGLGITYLYVRLRYDQGVFPGGLQSISAEVFGADDVYDPRTGLAGYSNNPALCVLHYMRSDFGLRLRDDEIDWASFSAAANICDEGVPLNSDGSVSQPRYTLDGTFKLEEGANRQRILTEMLSSCAGTLVNPQGVYRLYVGAYEAPTDTLGISEMAGNAELVTRMSLRETFNTVTGIYVDPEQGWQDVNFPPYSEASFVAEDGESIEKDIRLPFTIDATRAQRLAKLALRRARESLTIRVPVRFAGMRYGVWQTVAITMEDFGWDAKPFRISEIEFDSASGRFFLTMREEGAGSYGWLYDDAAAIPPASNTSLVDPFAIPTLVGLAATEELYVSRDGTTAKTRAILRWAEPAFPFVTGYDVQFRRVGETEWRSAIAQTTAGSAFVDDVARGDYEWRVRARSTVAVGGWASVTQSVGGLAAMPPAVLTGLSIQTIGGLAFLRWNQSQDIDVVYGGKIEVRHTPETSGVTWINATSIGDAVPGNATFTVLPLKAGTYFLKAVDATGVYGDEASVTTDQATAQAYAAVGEVEDDPAFAGVKTGVVVSSGVLKLDSGGEFDDVPDVDAALDIDGFGGLLAEGMYEFSGGIDQGAVKRLRLTSRIAAAVVNTFDQIDARSLPVDEWLSFDGVVGGEADAWVEVRQTLDDPTGTPVWSEWRRLDAAEAVARAFEFRAQLRSQDPGFNIEITDLSVTAEAQAAPSEVVLTAFAPSGLPVTRAHTPSTAITYEPNAAGLFVPVGQNLPRFTTSGRLRVNPSAANVLDYARTPFSAGWTNTGITSAVSADGPDGVAGQGFLVTESSTTSNHRSQLNTALVSVIGEDDTLNWLVAAGTCTNVQLCFSSTSHATGYANFVLTGAGSVGTVGANVTDKDIEKYDDFYLCRMTATASAAGVLSALLMMGNTAANGRLSSFLGTGRTITSGWAWMDRTAIGTTPILPEIGMPAATTRATDVPVWTPGVSPAQFTLIFDFELDAVSAATNQGVLQLDGGSDNDRIVVRNPSGGADLEALVVVGGSTVATLSPSGAVTAGAVMRCCLRVSPSGVALSFGGGAVVSASVAPPAMTRGLLGHGNTAGTEIGVGTYGDFRLLRALVSDAEMRSLST